MGLCSATESPLVKTGFADVWGSSHHAVLSVSRSCDVLCVVYDGLSVTTLTRFAHAYHGTDVREGERY